MTSRRKNKATRKNRLDRRKLRRGGVQNVILGPGDGALVIRRSGRIQIHNSRDEVRVGNGAFWVHLLRWLFADGEDAAERRQILIDDYLVDVQEYAAAQRKAEIEEKAKQLALDEIAASGQEATDELLEELTTKHVAAIEEELEKARAVDEPAKEDADERRDREHEEMEEPANASV